MINECVCEGVVSGVVDLVVLYMHVCEWEVDGLSLGLVE